MLSEQAISLVFCEWGLRDDGFQVLLGELARRAPKLRLIALIQDESEYGEAIASGAFDAIPNPFRRSEVQWMVIHAVQDADASTHRPVRSLP